MKTNLKVKSMNNLIAELKTENTQTKVENKPKITRLTPEISRMLKELAEILNLSEAETVRRAIRTTYNMVKNNETY